MSNNATLSETEPPHPYRETHGVFKAVIITQNALSFVLNATFLVVLVKNRDLVQRKRVTYHIANFAVASTWYSLARVCLAIVDSVVWYKIFSASVYAAMLACYSDILLMSIERAAVLRKPFTWANIMTIRRICLAMLVIWIAAVSLTVVTYIFFDQRQIFMFVLYLLIGSLNVVSHFYTARRLKWQNRRTAEIVSNQPNAKRLCYSKASKIVVIIVSTFIITAYPYMLFQIIRVILTYGFKHSDFKSRIIIDRSLYVFALTNLIVNPIVYIWKVGAYRKAFCRMFKSFRRQR